MTEIQTSGVFYYVQAIYRWGALRAGTERVVMSDDLEGCCGFMPIFRECEKAQELADAQGLTVGMLTIGGGE